MDALGQEEFLEILEMIGESHGIEEALAALTTGNKSYMGTDLILTATQTQGSKEIRVNMSAALELYQKGMSKLDEKEMAISRLADAVEMEIHDTYKAEKRQVIHKINDMEASPSTYQDRLISHLYFHTVFPLQKIESIDVREEIYPLQQADLDHELNSLKRSVESAQTHIENCRQAVESLFDEDEKISKQFDLVRGV